MNLPPLHLSISPWLEQAWLQRYLDRELAPEEVAWFEAYLLDKPRLLDAIEADNALRAVMHAAAPDIDQALRSETAAHAEQTHAVPPERPLHAASARHLDGRARSRLSSLMALAASFVGGLGLASVLFTDTRHAMPAEPDAEAPARLMFDLLRGGQVELREDAGDPEARLMVVDIALPLGSRIAAARAEVGERSVDLPAARISVEGFATYTLPRSWRGRAHLHFDLQRDGGDALPPVAIAL